MQTMDSSITKTQKRNLTDMQEKFLDVLFGEAQGNPREAARIAGYSEHSYPKVIRNLKKENGDDYSNSTIKKVVEIFRILFDKALEEQFIKGINPAKTSTVRDWIPKVQHEKKIYLSHFEVNRIYQDFLE